MIRAMSTARLQQRSDHRLRELVQRVGCKYSDLFSGGALILHWWNGSGHWLERSHIWIEGGDDARFRPLIWIWARDLSATIWLSTGWSANGLREFRHVSQNRESNFDQFSRGYVTVNVAAEYPN
jgi:hypothetical protein